MTTHWGDSGDEGQFVTRLVAGGLTKCASVTVLHLADGRVSPATRRDGGIEVRELRATAGRPLSQAVLLASLGSGARHLPRVAGRDLNALEGGGSDEIVSAIGESQPDVLVIGGLQQSWPRPWPVVPQPPRTVVWPLIGDDALLELPGYRDVLEHADVVCAISATEHRRLSELPALPRSPVIERMHVPISVDRAAAGHRLPGLTRLTGYVVFLRGFPPGSAQCQEPPRYRRLSELLPGLAVADVSHQEWRIHGPGWERAVPYPASRTNLRRLMFHAIATVDLRPGGLIGREVIESLMLGTPVAVPVTSRSREPVEQSDGGIVFSEESELVAALRLFVDPRKRAHLAEQGKRWAEEHHGDQERFAAAVRGAVVGRG